MTTEQTQQAAAELVDRYLSLGISFQRSKLCALIACNEVVENMERCGIDPEYNEWIDIRNEIEAMPVSEDKSLESLSSKNYGEDGVFLSSNQISELL